MSTVERVTIEKKTDQLNFEDFLGGQSRIVTIAGVRKGNKEQQYDIELEGDARVWRPAVTVLKQLVAAWTDEAQAWAGRSAELYGDPEVKFGNEKVGGIRVSRLSHIDKPLSANLTVTRGRRSTFTVKPLPRVDILRSQWKTADPERRKAIEAEVAAIESGAQA